MTLKITKSGEKGGIEPPVELSKPIKKQNAHLPRKVSERILTLLGIGYAPREVVAEIKAEFDIDLKPWHVTYRDPRNVASKDLKQADRDFFYRVHREYISRLENSSGAHARTRVDRLEKIYDAAMAEGNLKAATNALKELRLELLEFKRAPDAGAASSSAAGSTATEKGDE